jgi:pyridoxal phosphate enzyme (YggS family)
MSRDERLLELWQRHMNHLDALPHSPLAEVRARIAAAARIAGRNPAEITLVAISKTHPIEAILPLIAAGQRVFGENRIAEAQAKWPALREAHDDIALHLVGQLQSNKADEAVALFDCIHSLDRSSLVAALARAMDKAGRRLPCFVQVNIGDEAQKGGCAIAALPNLLAEARAADIPLAGLMCVPPLGIEPTPFFALLDKLAADHGLAGRSMGMSGDFEIAIQLGATHVRVGSALFGARE